MSTPFTRAPHIEGAHQPAHPAQAPNAALLVDFDNVTMGMRSDLSKELKALLNSDIIKGKVTVQRAYADWRRYPQYIVPLSEASVDLIFAPAYGSSKKNATDIRMAIDGMELVFTRPEIGTYILLTGDSDFSSLVLKLKEYGKYVIGVGIQESSSDILVQNCDEYYSYTSISGLRKTSDGTGVSSQDPWVLVEKAVDQMVRRNDVMRSDRLKQVMLEIDPGFEEKSFGFSKFSRFITEAAQKGLLQLRKMDNGQYEVSPKGASAPGGSGTSSGSSSRSQDRNGRSRGGRRSEPRKPEPPRSTPSSSQTSEPQKTQEPQTAEVESRDLASAYELLQRSIRDLLEDHEGESVRDSDVKRRMLAIQSSFDEAELGFSKFSRFLRQADDDKVVNLKKGDNGQYQVSVGAAEPAVVEDAGAAEDSKPSAGAPTATERPAEKAKAASKPEASPATSTPPSEKPAAQKKGPEADSDSPVPETRRLRPRLSSRRRGKSDGPPPLLEGQVVGAGRSKEKESAPAAEAPKQQKEEPREKAAPKQKKEEPREKPAPKKKAAAQKQKAPAQKKAPKQKAPTRGASPSGGVIEPSDLHLPTGRKSVIKYLSNSYAGVGQKTAESLVDELGEDLFRVLQTDPSRVEAILPKGRSERVLEGWKEDFARRKARYEGELSGADSSR